MGRPPILEVKNISFHYLRDRPVLTNVSFDVFPGESIAVLGANASGKSTLLHILDGLYFPIGGSASAFGIELTADSVETLPFSRNFRKNVGFLFQNSDTQLFCNTVREELAFGPLQLRLSDTEIEERINDTLDLFEIRHLEDRSPQTLSGGEKKKIALAGIFTCSPSVVLLDEPGSGLDPRSQKWLADFLRKLHTTGVTLIISTHDLAFAAEVTGRALILSEEHRLVYDGPIQPALQDHELLHSVNLIRLP